MVNRIEKILDANLSIKEKEEQIESLNRLRSDEKESLAKWQTQISIKRCHVSRWRNCTHPKQECRGLRDYEILQIASMCNFPINYDNLTDSLRQFSKSEAYARYRRMMSEYGTYVHESCAIDELSFSNKSETAENACEFRGYLVRLDAWVDKDWGYYSKSYGHPKVDVSDRKVDLVRKGKIISLTLKSFRQNEILEAIAAHFGWSKPSRTSLNRTLATSAWFDVQPSVKRGDITYYKQVFCKEIVGYVAVKGDVTFHASTIDKAKTGLEHKIEAEKKTLAAKEGKIYTANSVNTSYGFCFPGMREFCESVGLDFFGSYTFREIKDAMAKCPRDLVVKYWRELKLFGLI